MPSPLIVLILVVYFILILRRPWRNIPVTFWNPRIQSSTIRVLRSSFKRPGIFHCKRNDENGNKVTGVLHKYCQNVEITRHAEITCRPNIVRYSIILFTCRDTCIYPTVASTLYVSQNYQLVSFTRLGRHSLLDTIKNLGLLQILLSPICYPSYSPTSNTPQITKALHFRHNLNISTFS